MKKIAVGIDIGGTNTNFGLVEFDGKILATGSISTSDYDNFNEFLKSLVREIENTFSQFKKTYEIIGYGTGAPNANYFKGTIEQAPNLKWKGTINYNKILTEITNKPSYITNDANAAALGEKIFGCAKQMNDFVVITLGTGLGSGIFCNGKLLYGSTGHAGELGHVIVKENGRACGCGRMGCLETYASATGLVKTVTELINTKRESYLQNNAPESLNSKMIYEAAKKGDILALEAFEISGEILGKALANAVAVLNPEAIFLHGGLAKAGNFIFKPTIKYFESNLLNIYKNTVRILPSGLETDKAAILGAAALCLDKIITK